MVQLIYNLVHWLMSFLLLNINVTFYLNGNLESQLNRNDFYNKLLFTFSLLNVSGSMQIILLSTGTFSYICHQSCSLLMQ